MGARRRHHPLTGVQLFRAGIRDGLDHPHPHYLPHPTFRAGAAIGRRLARP